MLQGEIWKFYFFFSELFLWCHVDKPDGSGVKSDWLVSKLVY